MKTISAQRNGRTAGASVFLAPIRIAFGSEVQDLQNVGPRILSEIFPISLRVSVKKHRNWT